MQRNVVTTAPPWHPRRHRCSNHEWRHVCYVKGYDIVSCGRCAILATADTLAASSESVYVDLDDRHYEDFCKYALRKKQYAWGRFFERLAPWKKSGRLIDVGCSYGHFVADALDHGW